MFAVMKPTVSVFLNICLWEGVYCYHPTGEYEKGTGGLINTRATKINRFIEVFIHSLNFLKKKLTLL